MLKELLGDLDQQSIVTQQKSGLYQEILSMLKMIFFL